MLMKDRPQKREEREFGMTGFPERLVNRPDEPQPWMRELEGKLGNRSPRLAGVL